MGASHWAALEAVTSPGGESSKRRKPTERSNKRCEDRHHYTTHEESHFITTVKTWIPEVKCQKCGFSLYAGLSFSCLRVGICEG